MHAVRVFDNLPVFNRRTYQFGVLYVLGAILVSLLDKVFNRKIRKHSLDFSCCVIHGERGAGKSTTFALFVDEAKRQGREVYCQFPYDGVHMIPLVAERVKGVTRFDIDKDWLYSHEFEEGAVILIDEGSTVWPARDYSKWSKLDSDFFNFIRKQHITIAIAVQYYDQLDLNVKRAADETWFESKSLWIPSFTTIETSKTMTVKIADNNTEVVGKAFKRGARKVVYDICEIPLRNYHLWRKPYYGKFLTDYVPFKKTPQPQPLWNDLVNFEN